jgi:uncharacterized membrane protein YfcA
LAVIGAGFLAGFINTVAGSGSLITLPLLIFLGMPASVANGTNRVGVLFQNIVAMGSFRRSGILDLRGAVLLSLPAMAGSLIGAQIAVNLNEVLMRRAIGAVMVLMLVVTVLRPNRWLEGELEELPGLPDWKSVLILFAIGIYGGFIQAGVGIFLLAGLVLSVGYNLVRANPVKIVIVLLFTITSLLIFSRNDQVDWGVGLVLSVGNMAGAWIAARMSIRRGAAWIHRLLIVVIIFSAASLLGVFELIGGLI